MAVLFIWLSEKMDLYIRSWFILDVCRASPFQPRLPLTSELDPLLHRNLPPFPNIRYTSLQQNPSRVDLCAVHARGVDILDDIDRLVLPGGAGIEEGTTQVAMLYDRGSLVGDDSVGGSDGRGILPDRRAGFGWGRVVFSFSRHTRKDDFQSCPARTSSERVKVKLKTFLRQCSKGLGICIRHKNKRASLGALRNC